MLPIDGSYLYKLGGAIRPLTNINSATTWNDAWLHLYIAAGELEKFINDSVYSRSVRTSRTSANELLASLKSLIERVDKTDDKDSAIGPLDAYLFGSMYLTNPLVENTVSALDNY